jgi:hypothetical protein
MPRYPVSVVDRDTNKQRETTYVRSMTGADASIARRPEVVGWLKRVYAEMDHESRDWKCFDKRRLRGFLRATGQDLEKALEAHEDTFPIPEEVGRLKECIDCLRGASFLNTPAENACLLIEDRAKRTPTRR